MTLNFIYTSSARRAAVSRSNSLNDTGLYPCLSTHAMQPFSENVLLDFLLRGQISPAARGELPYAVVVLLDQLPDDRKADLVRDRLPFVDRPVLYFRYGVPQAVAFDGVA